MTPSIGLLMAARVLMSAQRAFAGILVPIYLAQLGYNGTQLGVLFAATALTSALLSALVGLFSDRIGRKPFIIILPLFAAAAGVVFAVSQVAALLFIFAALGSFGRGAGAGAGAIGPYQPAEQALLADAVPARERNSLFGRIAFASSLGALIGAGPLAALPDLLPQLRLVSTRLSAYHIAFLVMAAFAVAAGLIAIPVVEVRRRTAASPAGRHTHESPRASLWARSRPQLSHQSWAILLRFWATNSVNGLAVGFFGPFITYWFYLRYGAGPAEIGALYSVINLAALVSNLYAARLARRLGLVRAIIFGRAFQALLIVPMVFAPTFWLAGAFYLVRMMAQRIALPLRQSYVMGIVQPEERGTVGALSNLPSQVTMAVSPTIAGELFDHVSLELPFLVGAFLQGVNAALYFVLFRHVLPPEEQHQSPESKEQSR